LFLAENPLCYYHGLRDEVVAAGCVDHATPVSRGGAFWDAHNHRAACIACNSAKGDRTEAEYRASAGVLR
jgi:5-methylcytosine-specific restriction endonuclease McrA